MSSQGKRDLLWIALLVVVVAAFFIWMRTNAVGDMERAAGEIRILRGLADEMKFDPSRRECRPINEAVEADYVRQKVVAENAVRSALDRVALWGVEHRGLSKEVTSIEGRIHARRMKCLHDQSDLLDAILKAGNR